MPVPDWRVCWWVLRLPEPAASVLREHEKVADAGLRRIVGGPALQDDVGLSDRGSGRLGRELFRSRAARCDCVATDCVSPDNYASV